MSNEEIIKEKKSIPEAFSKAWDDIYRRRITFPGPSAWIQWIGTSICTDVDCSCGYEYQVHADFSYYVRCPKCKKVFQRNPNIQLVELTDDEFQALEAYGVRLCEPEYEAPEE